MLISVLVLAVFAVWLIASVLNQVHDGRALRSMRRLDVGSLIPAWTFFAPRPGVTDHVLVYRDLDHLGHPTPWRPLRSPARPLRSAVWNPEKRVEKLITDCASSLSTNADDSPLVALEAEYLLLQRMGIEADKFASATGTMRGLELKG